MSLSNHITCKKGYGGGGPTRWRPTRRPAQIIGQEDPVVNRKFILDLAVGGILRSLRLPSLCCSQLISLQPIHPSGSDSIGCGRSISLRAATKYDRVALCGYLQLPVLGYSLSPPGDSGRDTRGFQSKSEKFSALKGGQGAARRGYIGTPHRHPGRLTPPGKRSVSG